MVEADVIRGHWFIFVPFSRDYLVYDLLGSSRDLTDRPVEQA